MAIARGLVITSLLLLIAISAPAPTAAGSDAPAGQLTWEVHISLAPTWFDPAETSGIGLIAGYAFSAPYEEVKLTAR